MSVLIFIVGFLAGAVGATIVISAGYGTDTDDYYNDDCPLVEIRREETDER